MNTYVCKGCGVMLDYDTCVKIYGEKGTNPKHFHQLPYVPCPNCKLPVYKDDKE